MSDRVKDTRKLLNEFRLGTGIGGIAYPQSIGISSAMRMTEEDMNGTEDLMDIGIHISKLFNELKQAILNIPLGEVEDTAKEELLNKLKELNDYYINNFKDTSLLK